MKLFRNAIIDGDDDKAVSLYTLDDGEKCLVQELPPNRPIPSKKNTQQDTPLIMSSRYALKQLIMLLLEHGGHPGNTNGKKETSLHALCSRPEHPTVRRELMDVYLHWEAKDDAGLPYEKVSINSVDADGNAAIHYAAANGLLECVEHFVQLGAIISLVNKSNLTCCEMADSKEYKELATMLELALVFQPEDSDMTSFSTMFSFEYDSHPGRLMLDTKSFTSASFQQYVEACIVHISTYLGWMDAKHYRSRAEALLNHYSWDVEKLIHEYSHNTEQVLSAAKMDPKSKTPIANREEDGHRDASPPQKNAEQGDQKPAAIEDEDVLDLDLNDITLEDEVTCGACVICGEDMLPEKDIMHFQAAHGHEHGVDEAERRALTCLSGHCFCLNCWSNHVSIQVNDNGLGCLPCPAYKCGEILDFQWAPILLKSSDMMQRLQQHRQRHILDLAGYKTCPVDGCGLIIYSSSQAANHTHGNGVVTSPTDASSANAATAAVMPPAAICSNGHAFCMTCTQVAHTPCACSDVLRWQQLLREEMQVADVKDPEQATSGDDLANALWVAANTKRCPRCSTAIEKDEGCNHMR